MCDQVNCKDCEKYEFALKLIKKYYKYNALLNFIIKKALNKEEIKPEEISQEDWSTI